MGFCFAALLTSNLNDQLCPFIMIWLAKVRLGKISNGFAGKKSNEMRGLSLLDLITLLSSATKLPVIVKGVLTPEDAELAVQSGVAGVFVSNHGARQLDTLLPTVSWVIT